MAGGESTEPTGAGIRDVSAPGSSPVAGHRAASSLEGDDLEALQVLKIGGAIALFFLFTYSAYDLAARPEARPALTYYLLLFGVTLLFFGVTWTRFFQRLWKVWALLLGVFLIAVFVRISATTHEPESRFIVLVLLPLATASFVSWGPKWQSAMGAVCLLGFIAANRLVPIESGLNTYRWLGVCAAVAFAQGTSIFIERYRLRLRRQLDQLEEASRFRETQIATMAHDIRSPVATLVGYAELLSDGRLRDEDRSELLGRLASTAWNTNLVVTNVLDLYRLEKDTRIAPPSMTFDLNGVVRDVAEDCATYARHKGLSLCAELSPLPEAAIEPSQIERIVRNLVSQAIARTQGGEIVLRTLCADGLIGIEVNAPGAKLSSEEIRRLLERPGERSGNRGLGLYVARMIAEGLGGEVRVSSDPEHGLLLAAELPDGKSASADTVR